MVDIEGMEFPLDRGYYTENGAHLWVKPEGELVRVGMDAFAAHTMGNMSFLAVEKRRTKSGEPIGSFESAKFVSQLRAPLDGEVVEVNDEVVKDPRMINDDPYESWILAIRPDRPLEGLPLLLSEEEVRGWIGRELDCQRDWVTITMSESDGDRQMRSESDE
jgi:glycine cleavage system H protein